MLDREVVVGLGAGKVVELPDVGDVVVGHGISSVDVTL